jgi:methionyl-tRNA formyltransferase
VNVVLLSRYPRVDTPGWKRSIAAALREAGADVAVFYTRSSLADQARAGLRENGLAVLRRYRGLRARPAAAGEPAETLSGWAARHGVPVRRHRDLHDTGALEDLAALRPDVMVLAGADIVPAAALEIPAIGTVNGHYGLLPRYRGMNVTEWSIYNDDPVGVSVHLVDPGIDTGAIVAREPVRAASGDDLVSLREKHRDACARLLVEATLRLAGGTAEPVEQRPAEGRQYYRMHPALREVVERRLAERTYRWLDAGPERLAAALA